MLQRGVYASLRLTVERTGKVNDPDAREISLAAQVGDRNLGSARRWYHTV